VVPGHRPGNFTPQQKISRMKTTPILPSITKAEIEQSLRKTETIQIRLTAAEKAEVVRAKDELGLTTTEYLLKCSELVSSKLFGK